MTADADQHAQMFRTRIENALRRSGDVPPRDHTGIDPAYDYHVRVDPAPDEGATVPFRLPAADATDGGEADE